MKNLLSKTLSAFLLLFVFQAAQAQTLNKKSLLSDLDNPGTAKLNSQQQKEYNEANKKLADDLFELNKNAKTKEERDKGIDDLFDKRDKDIDKIFGADDTFKDAKKELKKNTFNMRMKIKLAKLVL